MEDWIDIVKKRLLDAEAPLPPGDWEEFEAASLPARRTRVLPWLIPALAVAAAAALFVILKPREETGTVPDQPVAVIERVEPDVPVTVAEALPPTTKPVPVVHKPSSVPTVFPRDVNEEPVPETVTETQDNSVPEQAVAQESASPEDRTEWADVFGSETPADTKPHRKFSVSPHIGGPGNRGVVQTSAWKPYHVPEIMASGGGYSLGGVTDGPVSYQSWEAHHSLPLTIGLEMSYFPVSRLALTSGLDLSLYRSTFVRPEHPEIAVRQQAYYLGIPFRVDWVALQAGRLSAWLGAGGKVDLCISARQAETAVTEDDAFNWSAMADLSLQYALTNNLGLYVQPEVSWFFKPAEPALLTYRTEHPLMVTVNAGLRIGF